jgi:hypothetical protein
MNVPFGGWKPPTLVGDIAFGGTVGFSPGADIV